MKCVFRGGLAALASYAGSHFVSTRAADGGRSQAYAHAAIRPTELGLTGPRDPSVDASRKMTP